ncbi:hypothetical protein [Delftia sp. HK171]|uniref:hypothetical protein n=1 Tax=Delftia sp. HK171 TaxID=1920191 RepID=UPI00115237B5|nr:hypothetical protein [Delftia sp. HK171]
MLQFGGRAISVSHQAAVSVSPGKRFHFTGNRDFEQFLPRLDHHAITDAWRRMTVWATVPAIYFHPMVTQPTFG